MERINRIVIITFFTLLLTGLLVFLMADPNPDNGNTEKRVLADMPAFSLRNYAAFPREFEAYLNDHFPLRSQLIRLHSLFEYQLFHRFADSNVMIGKQDWFFYNPRKSDEKNAIMDYKGISAPSVEELGQIQSDLEGFKDWLAEKGIDFVIVLSPNKARIYPEYLPGNVKRLSNRDRADSIAAFLKENSSLHVVYSGEVLEKAKGDNPLYYMHDDHWNDYGAYLAADQYWYEMSGSHIPAPELEFVSGTGGELADWANLSLDVIDRNQTKFESESLPTYQMVMNEGRWTSREYTSELSDGETLFVIGDSFATAFLPYLAPYYSRISYRRYDIDYDYRELLEINPQLVMLELTERFFCADVLNQTLQTE